MLNKIEYCIEHETYFPIEHDMGGDKGHVYVVTDTLDFCYGPFVDCPPPEITEDYWKFLFENESRLDDVSMM